MNKNMVKKKDESSEFEEIYLSWFTKLKYFAKEYVICEEDAENIVQDVFLELWDRRLVFADRTRLAAYLFTSVKNKSLNCLRRRVLEQKRTSRVQDEYYMALQVNLDSLEFFDHILLDEEQNVEQILKSAIDALPERCRQIFIMNKLENKKQKDIAEELQISIDTVETQIGIAYKKLRISLKKYKLLLSLLFSSLLFSSLLFSSLLFSSLLFSSLLFPYKEEFKKKYFFSGFLRVVCY